MLPLHQGYKIGLREWIRTTSLLTPNQAVYQIDITHRYMVDRNGIEPFLQACKARVPPTTPTAHIS